MVPGVSTQYSLQDKDSLWWNILDSLLRIDVLLELDRIIPEGTIEVEKKELPRRAKLS